MIHRLLTLVTKELQSLLRERQTRIILILPVIIQVLVFPFAATLDVTGATVAIMNQDNGHASIELTQRIAQANTFSHVILLHDEPSMKAALDRQSALIVVRFEPSFSRHLANGDTAHIQLLLDGRNSNSAQIAAQSIEKLIKTFSMTDQKHLPKSQLITRHWYNPNLNYRWFVVPSLIALITTIGVLIVTALSVAREREQGTLEQLLVSPLSTVEIFMGKAVPAIIIAIGQATIVLLAALWGYQIPFAGSLPLFYGSMLLYGISLIGFGLLISALCNTQQQAFIGVFVFMMPAILLSGYVAPIDNMPSWLQTLTWMNPVRHFTEITKIIYLKGAGIKTIMPQLVGMALIACITISLAYVIFKRKIV